jgi:uncharacterized membrane protein YphA (DoxX/SURF4 family)
MKKNTASELIALLYVCLFLYTAISKLTTYEITREQMSIMPLVAPMSGIITWLLPVVEIILSLVIFFPRTRRMSLYAGTALMLAFTVYVAYMMKYYSHLPCTCGGILQALSWPQHLLFNGVFVLLGILAIRWGRDASAHNRNAAYSLK